MTKFLTGIKSIAPDAGSHVTTLSGFFAVLLNVFIGVGIAMSVIVFVISGIQYMSSTGDPKKVDIARRTFTYGIVGFVLTVLSISIRIILFQLIGIGGQYVQNVPTVF